MAAPEPPLLTSTLRNPTLSATINADSEALRNDLEQARELAAEYQRQLASKTNDFGELNRLFQKAMEDFAHLEASVTELRQERHRLANAAMRGAAFERQLKIVTDERNRLIHDLHELKRAIESPVWLETQLRRCRAVETARKADAAEARGVPENAPEQGGGQTREFINLSFEDPSDSDGICIGL